MKKFNIFLTGFVIISVAIATQALYVVNETERAVKLRFGEIVQFDGSPGLHFKWPILNSVRKSL